MNIDRTRYLTIEEAAKESGYDYEYLRRRVKAGTIASIPLTDRVRLVDYQDLLRYKDEKPQRKPHGDKKQKVS